MEDIRYFHKDGMARRINNEWVIDEPYKTEITFPMRVTIGAPAAPLMYEDAVQDARPKVGAKKPIRVQTKEGRAKPDRPSPSVLVSQYVDEGIGLRALAAMYARTPITIEAWLEDAGLVREGRKRYKKKQGV